MRRAVVSGLFPLRLESALLLALTIASCGQSTNKYTDPGKTFTLHYPTSWAASIEAGAAVFAAPGSGPRPSLVVTRVLRKEGPIARTETSLVENIMVQYKALQGFSLLRSAPTRLAGQDAQLLSVAFMNSGVRYRKDQYIIPLREHFLVVDCNGPASMFDEKLFSKLLATLEVSR